MITNLTDREKRLMAITNNLYCAIRDSIESDEILSKYLELEVGVSMEEINLIQDTLSNLSDQIPTSLIPSNQLISFQNDYDLSNPIMPLPQ